MYGDSEISETDIDRRIKEIIKEKLGIFVSCSGNSVEVSLYWRDGNGCTHSVFDSDYSILET